MSAGQRQRLLDRLEQLDQKERGILANARCLAEGVDVPTIDGVAFIDPRRSEVDIVQAVGRVIRKAENKKLGTIVIPVFVESTNDPESELEKSVFKPIWDVIKALRSHDDDLGLQLDVLRRELGRRRGRLVLPPKIHIDMPKTVGIEFERAFEVRLLEQVTASWEHRFGLLEQFVEENGHALVPQSHKVGEVKLGGWVTEQRTRFAEGALDPERERQLSLVKGWAWNAVEAAWDEGLQWLEEYVKEKGHAQVGAREKFRGFRLGQWVANQRAFHSRGELRKDRVARLRAVSGWSWTPREDEWERGFAYMQQYVEQTGSAIVTTRCRFEGFSLGTWVTTQRRNYSMGRLEKKRVQLLQRLDGWEWDSHFAAKWEKGYRRLKLYRKRMGHVLVEQRYRDPDDFRLGTWVLEQRQMFREGRMPKHRQERLEAVDGWAWNAREALWNEHFRRVRDYVTKNGNARFPRGYKVDGFDLHTWVSNQRALYVRGELRRDRVKRLGDVPGWVWRPRERSSVK